jgi:SagB-type dehydrogenase family enzyme
LQRRRDVLKGRYVRSPNVTAYWEGNRFLLEEYRYGTRVEAKPIILELLDAFSLPTKVSEVARRFPDYTSSSVRKQVENLRRLHLLEAAAKRQSVIDVAQRWRGAYAAAHYHFVTRDLAYITNRRKQLRFAERLKAREPAPSLYKVYRFKPRRELGPASRIEMPLQDALLSRRTIRRFRDLPATARDVASILSGTWGQTGWIDTPVLGKLVAKSSPSGGARHPIECYLIAWNVRSLEKGLYHYNVRDNVLELLKRGDFREVAVAISSGHQWIRKAAFLCVMTAIADRTFWKYRNSKAYSIFLLDAGHLGQTFMLLTTAVGLGGFTTAAIQHSQAEAFIGLDGVSEFPVYLCGAGVPATRQPKNRRQLEKSTISRAALRPSRVSP